MSARTVQPGFSFEYFMWIFTRISGLAMIVLAITGLSGALLMGARTQMDLPTLMRWADIPNANDVVNSNIPDVAVGGTAVPRRKNNLTKRHGGHRGFLTG